MTIRPHRSGSAALLALPALLVLLATTLLACAQDWRPRTLTPGENPFGPSDPRYAPQPRRGNPLEVVVEPGGRHAWVSLQGSEDEPGHEVVRVALDSSRVVARVPVGSGPTGLALHPDGSLLLVANRFSNWISVVDVRGERELQRLPADPYTIDLAFSPDGGELWLTNRWRDAVTVWEVERQGRGLAVRSRGASLPTATNPRDLAISADGAAVAVGALTGLSVTIVDRRSRQILHEVSLGAPSSGLAFAGDHLVVATLSASTHHLPRAGPDTDHDGQPGDGTPNVNFQDLQNELAVIDWRSGQVEHRYTSDTICCQDFRDVAPEDIARAGELLPPEDTWIVGGALPEQVAVAPDGAGFAVWVTYSASDELQRFALDPATGALAPAPVIPTSGHAPHGVAVVGDGVVVAHRLSETLGRYEPGGAQGAPVVVGDVSGGAFPATDAEIGELFNFVTAPFSVDGDQSCAHCHREGGNLDKALSMPLTRRPGIGLRQVMAYRGAADSRPWFFEAAMDEANFKPVINEFARVENFCCTDYTLWGGQAPADCASNPPAVCAEASNAGSPDGFAAGRAELDPGLLAPRPTAFASRDAFFLNAAQRVLGRTESFGDGLFFEDPVTEGRSPITLDFDGITRALGLFLLQEPRLLPNPNDPDRAVVRRGRALFEDPTVGCAFCHPAPTFGVSTDNNPEGLPLRFAPVVSPVRATDGTNLDLFAGGFAEIFPAVEMDSCVQVCGPELCEDDPSACDDLRDVRFGATSLRGIWDRADGMLHHGRARGLREVLCPPGHAALGPGEVGFNEVDGIPDTHGSTSQLTPAQIEELIAYLLTL